MRRCSEASGSTQRSRAEAVRGLLPFDTNRYMAPHRAAHVRHWRRKSCMGGRPGVSSRGCGCARNLIAKLPQRERERVRGPYWQQLWDATAPHRHDRWSAGASATLTAPAYSRRAC